VIEVVPLTVFLDFEIIASRKAQQLSFFFFFQREVFLKLQAQSTGDKHV
jgi:hypothetical protein